MKKALLFIFLSFTIFSFSQKPTEEQMLEATKKWVYLSSGNPIDGYKKTSIRINDGAKINDFCILKIENHSALLKLKNSMGEGENDRDDLIIELRTQTSHSLSDLNELFMYFDNEKFYYKVNFRVYDDNGLLWWNAVESNNTKFLDRFDFINKLKLQSKVVFRFVFSDGKYDDFTFSLNGSKFSLDQTIDLSNFTDEIDNGFKMDSVYGLLRIADINNDENLKNDLLESKTSLDDFNSKLLTYLEKNLGEFYSTFIGEIKYENKILYFYDFNDKVILEIDIVKELL
jgi:hypothetical protein